jgi:hypothetical protein
METDTRTFGPFQNVPAEQIRSTGFVCGHCKRPVEMLAQSTPNLAPRMIFRACRCGTVVVWEDETQATEKTWWHSVKLMRKARVNVVMFNGAKPTTPEFQGVN